MDATCQKGSTDIAELKMRRHDPKCYGSGVGKLFVTLRKFSGKTASTHREMRPLSRQNRPLTRKRAPEGALSKLHNRKS
jgi:hypothetical protein